MSLEPDSTVSIAMRRLRDSGEMAATVIDLAERWERARAENEKYGGEPRTFTSGRMEGYTQAIQLMLGLSHAETVEMLRNRRLTT